MTTEVLPCETDPAQVIHDRSIEIRTLQRAARAVLEISPEAAGVLRDSSRRLLKVQVEEITKQHDALK